MELHWLSSLAQDVTAIHSCSGPPCLAPGSTHALFYLQLQLSLKGFGKHSLLNVTLLSKDFVRVLSFKFVQLFVETGSCCVAQMVSISGSS